LAVLLSLSAQCFSESVSPAEIATALELILTELETALMEQETISQELDETRMRQSLISETLETLQTERLPDISRQLTSLETFFR
jgi:hypothetical protein